MNALATVQQVVWHEDKGQCPLLKGFGILHGFVGREGDLPDVYHVNQVHGSAIDVLVDADQVLRPSLVNADGILSTSAERAIGIKTADCLPVLMADKRAQVVLAIHAGWRGFAQGVLSEGLKAYYQAGGGLEDLLVSIGPAISVGAYEVGQEVVHSLQKAPGGLSDRQIALAITKGVGDRWHVDLQMAGVLNLVNQGVSASQVSVLRQCTYHRDKDWHSYRRTGENAGRNWSWIRCR